jgi:glucokinase
MMNFYTLGIDLGGTKINVGLVDVNGHILSKHYSLIEPFMQPSKVLSEILNGIDVCLSVTGQEADSVGIGIAAQVDLEGVVQSSPNLGWKNFPLKKKLEENLNLPVFVTNDVRAATWGERYFGAGRGIDDLVVLFVGTGVGGGVISGGNLLVGCTNTGAELGHITLVYDGRKCRCPNRGCLEAYVGGWAIAERAQEVIRSTPDEGKFILSLTGCVEKVTAANVSQAYHKGNLLAQRLVEETGLYLAAGVVSLINAFNPCRLILGGGVVDGIPELIDIVKDHVQTNALDVSVKNCDILKSDLGSNAAVIGSALLARDLVEKSSC